MATMLEEPNKKYLHKNHIYFPNENHSIVLLIQYGRHDHTLLDTLPLLSPFCVQLDVLE